MLTLCTYCSQGCGTSRATAVNLKGIGGKKTSRVVAERGRLLSTPDNKDLCCSCWAYAQVFHTTFAFHKYRHKQSEAERHGENNKTLRIEKLCLHNASRQHSCRLNQLQATSHHISCFLSCYYGNWAAAVHITQIWYKSFPSCPKYAENHPAVPGTIGPICTEENSRNDWGGGKGTTWLACRSSLAAKKSPHTSLS